jgi:hypothetical protein
VLDQILYKYIELNQSPKEIIAEGFDPETVRKTATIGEHERIQAVSSPAYFKDFVESIRFWTKDALGGTL